MCLIRNNEMTLPYVLFEFASAELPFLTTRSKATSFLDDSFVIKCEEELTVKLQNLRDEQKYVEQVERDRVLKENLARRSEEDSKHLKKLLTTVKN